VQPQLYPEEDYMALEGSDYLFRLASLALSFVGFTAIIVALRRAVGGELHDFHRVVTRYFIETGLAITAFCVLPQAVNLTGIPAPTAWRVASGIAGFLATVLAVSVIRRARSIKSAQIPSLYINSLISILPLAALFLNAIGLPFSSSANIYALALTATLFLVWWSFLQNLEAFIEPPSSR
jgi:hypothetical protein